MDFCKHWSKILWTLRTLSGSIVFYGLHINQYSIDRSKVIEKTDCESLPFCPSYFCLSTFLLYMSNSLSLYFLSFWNVRYQISKPFSDGSLSPTRKSIEINATARSVNHICIRFLEIKHFEAVLESDHRISLQMLD